VNPRMAVGAVVATLLVAGAVFALSLLQTPIYEASAKVQVDPSEAEGLRTGTITRLVDSRSVAKDVTERLREGPETTLDMVRANLAVEQAKLENTNLLSLTYKDSDPYRAAEVVNTVAEVSSERISASSVAGLRASVYEKAVAPESPVSPKPLRNGLLTLVAGLALSAALMAGRPFLGRH